MTQKNSHRGLVNLLTTPAGTLDKLFLDFIFFYAKGLDPTLKRLYFFDAGSQKLISLHVDLIRYPILYLAFTYK